MRDRFESLLARVLLGALIAVSFTFVMIRGMWIDAMENRRTNLRD